MKKVTLLLFSIACIIASQSIAQVAVNSDGASANSKSILDVKSTTKGMLIPRMLTSERTTFGGTLTVTEKGMLVYDTEQGAFYYFDGAGWNKIANFGSADDDWTVSGDNMYSAVSGDVGIGKTSNFYGKLDVNGKIYADNSSGDGLQVNLAGNPTIAPLQWWSAENNGLEINGTQGNGIFVGAADKSGLYVHNTAENGVYIGTAATGLNINDATTDGIYIDNVGAASENNSSTEKNGVEIAGAEGNGVFIGATDKSGLYVYSAAENGLKIRSVGSPSTTYSTTDKNAIAIGGAEGHGLYIGQADLDGVHIYKSNHDGIKVYSAGTPTASTSSILYNGIEVEGAEGNGVFVGQSDHNGFYAKQVTNDGINIEKAGAPATVLSSTDNNGIEIQGAEGNGVFVGRAYKDGIRVYKAGNPTTGTNISLENNGIEINGAEGHGVYVGKADIDGVHIQTSGNDGVYIETASNSGIFVNSAAINGLYLNASGEDAIKIYRAGPSPSNFIPSAENNGVEIYGAEGNGLFVGRADQYGVYVESAGVDGIFVHNADHYGVYANTTVTNGYGFYTNDKIYGSNLTSKSSSTYGLNTGNQSLRPGDVVCIAGGMENNIEETENLFAINLEMANENNKQAVFGVVEYKVNIKTSINEDITADNQTSSSKDKSFAYIDGNINSGDYFSVIILGPAEVNIDSKTNIKVGDNVCIGNNGVSSQRVTEVNGISIAENVGILGKSMEAASGKGKMLVYVNCK